MRLSMLSFFVLAMLAFTACDKGDFVKDDIIKDVKETDKLDCYQLVYPVIFTMPDGSSAVMNNADDWAAIKAWYEAHPDSKADFAMQYPVEITSVKFDGVKVINNDEEMTAMKKVCEGNTDEVKVCDWDGSKVADPAIWETHIVKPLVTSEDCGGCTVSGMVKYVKIGTDFAYVVYYGKGECDEWAFLTTYYGATSDKKETKCKFKLDCDSGN